MAGAEGGQEFWRWGQIAGSGNLWNRKACARALPAPKIRSWESTGGSAGLLFVQVDGLVLVVGDAGADLRWGPALLGLLVSVEALLGAG